MKCEGCEQNHNENGEAESIDDQQVSNNVCPSEAIKNVHQKENLNENSAKVEPNNDQTLEASSKREGREGK